MFVCCTFIYYAVTLPPSLTLNISIHILHTLSHVSFGTDKENSFEDQSLLGWQSFPLI